MQLTRLFIGAFIMLAAAVSPAAAEKRVALVIGNSAYLKAGTLANPVNDASDTAKVLAKFGFEVILGLDLARAAFEEKVRAFSHELANADTAVLFYAGHGLQVAGHNYLLPIDAALSSERDLDFEAIPLDFVLKQMEVDREGKTNLVFLDACRDNPLARNLARSMGTRSASIGKGLAEVQTGVGTFIAYSTQPGNVALDGETRNSPFTAAFANRVQEPGRNLTAIMIGVRKDVLAATGGRQVPCPTSRGAHWNGLVEQAALGELTPFTAPGGSAAERLAAIERYYPKFPSLGSSPKFLKLRTEAGLEAFARCFDERRDNMKCLSDLERFVRIAPVSAGLALGAAHLVGANMNHQFPLVFYLAGLDAADGEAVCTDAKLEYDLITALQLPPHYHWAKAAREVTERCWEAVKTAVAANIARETGASYYLENSCPALIQHSALTGLREQRCQAAVKSKESKR